MPSEKSTLHKIKRITLDLPIESVKMIDNYCKEHYITRRKWFFDAMNIRLKLDESYNKEKN